MLVKLMSRLYVPIGIGIQGFNDAEIGRGHVSSVQQSSNQPQRGPAGWAALYPLQLIAHRCKCRKWRLPIDSSVYHKAKRYGIYESILVGGFNHLEKYESQWEGFPHILWKIKNVWNHQPVYIYFYVFQGSSRSHWSSCCWSTKKNKQDVSFSHHIHRVLFHFHTVLHDLYWLLQISKRFLHHQNQNRNVGHQWSSSTVINTY